MAIKNLSDRFFLSMLFAILCYSTLTEAAYRPFKRTENRVILSRVFSEEMGGYSGRMSGPVAGIKCFGPFCDDKQLISVQRSNGETAVSFTNFFTGFFSTSAFCPIDKVLVEIQCGGAYCAAMRLHCARMATGYRLARHDTATVDFFSEEQGEGLCPDGYYVYGIACRGAYCDDLKLYCARVDIQ